MLTGCLFDDRGNRISPSHVRKGGLKYRYYLSSALFHGAAERAGSECRQPRKAAYSLTSTNTNVCCLAHLGLGSDIFAHAHNHAVRASLKDFTRVNDPETIGASKNMRAGVIKCLVRIASL